MTYMLTLEIGGYEGGSMEFDTLDDVLDFVGKNPPEDNEEMIDEAVESMREENPEYELTEVRPGNFRKSINIDDLIEDSQGDD